MSYAKFLDDMNTFYKDAANKGIHYEIAWGIVRDAWIKNGRLEELINFLLQNWNEGNCDEFIIPIELHLKNVNNMDLFMKMWNGILKNRLRIWEINRTEDKRLFALEGISRFKKGLQHFLAFDEIEKLDNLSEAIKSNSKVKYRNFIN